MRCWAAARFVNLSGRCRDWRRLLCVLDRLSAVFLFVTGLVLFPASIFAGGELRRGSNQQNARAFTVLMLGLFASIALIFIAADAVLFLLAWEVMSVLSYLLIVHNRGQENGHASAGYLLLAMGEAGTLAAALSFLVLAINVNSVDFATLKSAASGLSGGHMGSLFVFIFWFRCQSRTRASEWLAATRIYPRTARVCSSVGRRNFESRALWDFAGQC